MVAQPKKRQAHISNKDLAMRIMVHGFEPVAEEVGDRMTSARASKIVQYLIDNGHDENKIPDELKALAAKRRESQSGISKRPARAGETREYTAGENLRIGFSTSVLGTQPKSVLRVTFDEDKITVTKKK